MQLKCTKKLAKILHNNRSNKDYSISLVKYDPQHYQVYCSNSYDIYYHDNDYDISTGLYSVIRVDYPDNYYAIPQYITTNDLIKIYKHCTVKTLEAFIEAFNEEIAI